MKRWQAIIFVLLMISVLAGRSVGQQKAVNIVWDHYEDPDSTVFFRMYEVIWWDTALVSEDSLQVETYKPPPPPAITVERIGDTISPAVGLFVYSMMKDDRWHYFVATAVDSAGNETTPSDIAFIFLKMLRSPSGLRSY